MYIFFTISIYLLVVYFFILSYFIIIINFVAHFAQLYLGIPASQASCERLFSIAKNDVVEKRTSMNPDLVESLLFLRKRKDIIDLIKG
jgi:hypothetical protein